MSSQMQKIVVYTESTDDRKIKEEEARRKDWWKSFWIGVGLGLLVW